MSRFPCPYLKAEVELTPERERHIAERHPDLLPRYRDEVVGTLAAPDEVRSSRRFGNAKMFSRWYSDVKRGKHVVVVGEADTASLHWIITAYMTKKLSEGEVEWKRN